MSTYINENWDGVTAPALPAGWTVSGGSGVSGVTSTANKYSGTNALRFSGLSSAYGYIYKTTTDTNHGNVWIEAKFSPVSISGSRNFFFLYARCTSNPSGATAPSNCYYFNGCFNNETYWQLQTVDGSGNRTQYLINAVTPAFTAGAWYRCIMSIENNADAVYQQVLCYVQRMSDSYWLLPDGTWSATQTAFFVATGNPIAYQSGWDTGTTAAFGCYLDSGQIIDMDDCIFQDTPFADATPASPPAAGNEVEMVPTGTTASDAGTSSHDATHLNASGFADYYRSITIGQYIYLDAGRALTPTAFVWAPALGATTYNDYSILLATGYEIFSIGAAIEGANSSSGPWTRLGQVASNRIPEPNIFTTQRLDSSSPGGTYRYYRFVPSPSLPCVLSQFRMITQWTSGMSWRPCKPIITPAAGRKAAGTTVTITSTTGTINGTATAIYYTTDGSTPTTSSTLYTGAITLASNSPAETVIKAIAYNSGASTTTSEVATGVFVVAAAIVPDTNATAYGTSKNWPQDWYDDRGVLLQTNSGHCFYDSTSGLYWLLGGNFNIGVTTDSPPGKRGWCVYSSTDLFNWTLKSHIFPVPAAWASAYGYQTRAHILVNPSPIDSNKKYVLWMHLGDSGGTAACATAPSMDGPWIWRTMAQPNSTTVGDCNLFYDVVDDGTGNSRNKAWFVFTSDSLTKIKICQLDPATDWTSFTGSNTQVYNNGSEAVVLFNYSGYYYLIFSDPTPYGAGASNEQYVSATTLAGLNSATPASIYSSSPGSAAEVAYNAQSTCLFQVNGLSSPGFIYMADLQDTAESPVNLYHTRMAWWPVSTTSGGNKVNAFPSAGTLSMPFPDSWDMSYLPDAVTVITVEKANQLLWNIRQCVSNANGISWNMRSCVNTNKNFIWNQRNYINRNNQLLWNQRSCVNKNNQSLWNLRTCVNKNIESLWNIRSCVNKDRQLLWNQRACVNSNNELLWNVRQCISNNKELLWNICQLVSKTNQCLWNVRACVANDKELLWNVRACVNASDQLLWNIRQCVNTNKQFQWDIRQLCGNNKNLLWNLRQCINSDENLLWNILSNLAVVTTSKDIELLWNLRQLVSGSKAFDWNIRACVPKENNIAWNIRQRVNSDDEILWNILSKASKDCQIVWDSRVLVGSLENCVWNIRQTVPKNYTGVWNVRACVSANEELLWNIRNKTNKDTFASWNIREIGGGNNTNVIWNIRAFIQNGLLIKWNVISNAIILNKYKDFDFVIVDNLDFDFTV